MNFNKLLVKLFGSRNERLIKAYYQTAFAAGEFEDRIKQLNDEELKAKTAEFKRRLSEGHSPAEILPEAFAVVREVAWRNIQMRHFDVQLIGGRVLFEGKIAEMATGEGKTLVATLAAYLVHLSGRKIHIVTVNDYLASRDAEWMSPVYNALDMTVGAIQSDQNPSGPDRRAQYECDITYGTNNEFGFDYLRDNMKMTIEQMAQGPLEYAIIDEVDSILVDEARTPLIISGPAFDDVTRYKKADAVARQLMSKQSGYDRIKRQSDTAERDIASAQGELSEAKKEKDAKRIERAQKAIEENQNKKFEADTQIESAVQFYEVEYDKKSVHLTHEGLGAAQEIAGVGSFFTGSNIEWPHLLEQSLRAHITFEREKDYVVMENKVIIVDDFTGRLMHGRQWSDGLHQAVEAKENVTVKEESQTLATITLQNFFKLYGQIAGMTGTAITEADEFMKIYGLDVVVIPTNRPCAREDEDDAIYKSLPEKFNAIVADIEQVSGQGRPVLVGTVSIEKSEAISKALTKKFGVEHEVLNAKQHEREAAIVAKAGHQHATRTGKTRGNVTIATNMAGRGTDIKLGEGVAELGGLHILGTERHEARRIDNQLRGRAGRQGDKGSSQFFLCFDDDLLKIFAPEFMVKALKWVGWQEGEPIYHRQISKGIERAQKKVEERNFDIRKSLLEYDEVMDYQRRIFYSRRRHILSGKGLKTIIKEMIDSALTKSIDNILTEKYPQRCVIEWARTNFGVDLKISDVTDSDPAEIESLIKEKAKDAAVNNVSLSLGEYLEDYSDSATWDIEGLRKWAMSAFSVSLPVSKIKHLSPEEIENELAEAAAEQIDKKDMPTLGDFFVNNFAEKTFAEWLRAKFDVKLDIEKIKDKNRDEVKTFVKEFIEEKYRRREIEYPVEFAMNMAFGPEGTNVYGFENLAQWANKKFEANLSADEIKDLSPQKLHKMLIETSEKYNDGQLEKSIESQIARCTSDQLAQWANDRFGSALTADDLRDDPKPPLTEAAKEFLRAELSDLERYVLLQVYDSTWKEHLYAMDHLKSSIWTRSFAEKDPKIEYK
ncbi:MAG: preprotein translocase subunit SecA, partial [Phycisphaerae bacterium]|nr:preprotein translocase subunit SecA [Phycisphaerae bacterium]